MAVRMTGAEFVALYTADWGEGVYWDDYEIEVNGKPLEVDYEKADIKPADKVRILSGVVYMGHEWDAESVAADTFAKRWLKARLVETVVLEIDKTHMPDAITTIQNITGVKVL